MPEAASASARLLPSARALRLVDLAIVLWVAAWIGLGIAIGIEVHQLTRLSQTISADGAAVQQVGSSLATLSALPFVGHTLGHTAVAVQRAGANAVAGGASSAASIRALSVLLAIAVALLPSVPVLVFYVPLRIARSREARALRHRLREQGASADLKALLAQRAVARLDYGRLDDAIAPDDRETETDRNGDVSERTERLAAAELRRLGIDPRALERREG